jgi:hypothetical protein
MITLHAGMVVCLIMHKLIRQLRSQCGQLKLARSLACTRSVCVLFDFDSLGIIRRFKVTSVYDTCLRSLAAKLQRIKSTIDSAANPITARGRPILYTRRLAVTAVLRTRSAVRSRDRRLLPRMH